MKPFDTTIHMSLKKRKAWGRKLRLVFLGLIVVLLLCSVCFTYGGVTWEPEDPTPKPGPEYWWQYLLLVVGAIVSVTALVLYPIYNYFEIKRFYSSQIIYFATPEFAKARENARTVDLTMLKPSDLKWYKNMGYISKKEMLDAKEKQKLLKKEAKQNGKKFVYARAKFEQK